MLTTIKEEKAYYDAKFRCSNPSHSRYQDWGGRGIEFKFDSFKEFYSELGPRPKGHSLDRINNDKHYQSGNVKWSTRSEQQLNKRVRKTNKFGITGVRQVKSKGLITNTYQAYVVQNKLFIQLYTGPDLNLAIKARQEYDHSFRRRNEPIS